MKSNLADAKEKMKGRVELAGQVARCLRLALDESGWSNVAELMHKVVAKERYKVEGSSGAKWTVDVAAVKAFSGSPDAVVYCVDLTGLQPSAIRGVLNQKAVELEDLWCDLRVLALKSEGKKGAALSKVPPDLEMIFYKLGVDVVEWHPYTALDFVRCLLPLLWRTRQPEPAKVKTPKDTVKALITKHPELFAASKEIQDGAKCIALLKKIKDREFEWSLGEIIVNAAFLDGIEQKQLGRYLYGIDDRELEKLLGRYLSALKSCSMD